MGFIEWDDIPKGIVVHFDYVGVFEECRKRAVPYTITKDTQGKAANLTKRTADMVERGDLPKTARAEYAKTGDDEYTITFYHWDQRNEKKRKATHRAADAKRRRRSKS